MHNGHNQDNSYSHLFKHQSFRSAENLHTLLVVLKHNTEYYYAVEHGTDFFL